MPMKRQRRYRTECFLCTENITEVTFRDNELLGQFTSSQNKILPRRKSGSCAKHQRHIAREIKRSRQLGLMRYRGQQ